MGWLRAVLQIKTLLQTATFEANKQFIPHILANVASRLNALLKQPGFATAHSQEIAFFHQEIRRIKTLAPVKPYVEPPQPASIKNPAGGALVSAPLASSHALFAAASSAPARRSRIDIALDLARQQMTAAEVVWRSSNNTEQTKAALNKLTGTFNVAMLPGAELTDQQADIYNDLQMRHAALVSLFPSEAPVPRA